MCTAFTAAVNRVVTELGNHSRGFTTLLRVQGEQHILAAAASSKQQADARKLYSRALWLKTGIQVAQNDCRANAHHLQQVLCHFKPSSLFYGRFSVQKWPFLGCFQDDRGCIKWAFSMRAILLW